MAVLGVLLLSGFVAADERMRGPRPLKDDCVKGLATAIGDDSITVNVGGLSKRFKLTKATKYHEYRIDKDKRPYRGRASSVKQLRKVIEENDKIGVDCAISVGEDNTAEIVCFGSPRARAIRHHHRR